MPQKTVSEIDLLAAGLGERSIALVRGDAEHFDPFRLRRADPYEDALAHGGYTREGFGREKLVDDYSIPVRSVVGIGERATRQDGRAQCIEITRQHDLEIDRLIFAGVSEG